MAKNLNIDALIESLQSASTPENDLIEKLAEMATDEPVEEIVEEEEKPEEEKPEEEKSADLAKVAELADDQGRIIARAFMDELNKIAVETVGMTVNTATEGENLNMHLSNKDVHTDVTAPADAVIRGLTAAVQAGGPQGEIGGTGLSSQSIAGTPADEAPVAGVSGTVKAASDKVIEALYAKYVGGE